MCPEDAHPLPGPGQGHAVQAEAEPLPLSSGDIEIDALMAKTRGSLWHLVNELEHLVATVKEMRAKLEEFEKVWERGTGCDN